MRLVWRSGDELEESSIKVSLPRGYSLTERNKLQRDGQFTAVMARSGYLWAAGEAGVVGRWPMITKGYTFFHIAPQPRTG